MKKLSLFLFIIGMVSFIGCGLGVAYYHWYELLAPTWLVILWLVSGVVLVLGI